jgi:hypothetical protein
MRKRARESICPGDCWECSKSSAIEHGIVTPDESWFDLSTVMNSSGFHEMKKFPKENGTQFNQKSHAHDLLESARVSFDQNSQEKIVSSTPAIISLRY